MATLYELLKADPYQTLMNNPTYIDANTFYNPQNGVYLIPSQSEEAARRFLTENYHAAKVIRLNGYAGCGKTLFAHYLIYKFETRATDV